MTAPKPIVIALTGRPGVGKDTVADLLAPALGFQRVAFADALRREIAEAWRLPVAMLTDRPTKEWPLPALSIGMCSDTGFMNWCHEQGESLSEPRSPRCVMQTWADYKRRYTPDHYAQIVARWVKRQIGTGWSRIVITDLRHRVECEALEPFGAQIIRITRPTSATLAADTAAHSSERHDLITPHHVINNDSGIPELAWNTLAVLRLMGVDVMKNPADLWLAGDWVLEGGAA
jgi:hypothetical protein